jgi:LSD1 subclass zinc finger protein
MIDDLADAAVGHTKLGGDSSRGSKGFGSRTPAFDSRAGKAIEKITDIVGGWSRGLARNHGLMISPPVTWHRPWDQYRHTAKDYAVFLAAHVDKLARDGDVGELVGDLRKQMKHAASLVDRRIPPQFCGPCPTSVTDHRRCIDSDGVNTCGYRLHACATRLMARRGASEVHCATCGATHRVETLVNHLLARADEYRCTIPEIHRVLRMLNTPVRIDTLYRWADPRVGKLKPAGYLRSDNRRIGVTRSDKKDKPVYRVADARAARENSIKPGRRGRPLKTEGK